MLNVSITVERNRIPQLRAQAKTRAKDAVKSACYYARIRSAPLTPVDHGDLKGRVKITFTSGGLAGTVVWIMPYGVFQELGTQKVIRPKRGKYLVFTVNGKKVFARKVRGVTAKHFARGGAEAATRPFLASMSRVYSIGGA